MAIIKCPECGHEISDKAPFCPSCGVAIANHLTTCAKCGKIFFKSETACPVCHQLADTDPNKGIQAEDIQSVQLSDNGSKRQDSTPDKLSKVPSRTSHNESETNAKRSHNNRIIVLATVAIVLAIIATAAVLIHSKANTDREEEVYIHAMSSSDPEELQNYLNVFTDAPEAHRDSIESHLTVLNQMDREWTNIMVSGSRSAIEEFIQTHPESPHKAEAVHKLDSIDWASAVGQNTVEAFEDYIKEHPDGEHTSDADTKMKSLNAKTIQPGEKDMVYNVFQGFFQCIENKDISSLPSIVNPLLTSFLGKSNASRSDVATFIKKIYKSDTAAMKWNILPDYTINKKEVGEDSYEYETVFSATQTIEHTDGTTEEIKYRIKSTINPNGLISELNMTKIIE